MFSKFYLMLTSLFGSLGARVLSGAGISIASYALIMPVILTALNLADNAFSGLPAAVVQLLAMSGIGSAFSIIASALIAKAAMDHQQIGFLKTVNS